MRLYRHVLPVLAVAALLATACTNDSGDDDAGKGSSSGDSTGVTDDTIKLAWPTINQQALVDAGFAVDLGDLTGLAKQIVDDWNANGGVGGRQVELVVKTYGQDLANLLPDMQKICLEITEDEEVFATVSQVWYGDAVTCIAGDHDTPLVVATSLPTTIIETGNDNIFSVNFFWEEAVSSSVQVLDAQGELDGFKKIGVFAPLEPGMREAIDNGLAPALEEAGSKLEVDGTIPFAIPVDNAAIAAVVSRFKAEKVDAVFGMGNFLFNGQFMTEADKQGYSPTYVMSDLSEGTEDLILTFAPPAQLENAIGASWKGHQPDPVPTEDDAACLEKFGSDLKDDQITQKIGMTQVCELFELTRQGLEGGGKDLTRGSFISAMEKISDVTASGGGTGGYGPDDHSYPNQVRLVRFDLDGCKCWKSEGDWVDVSG